MVIEVKNGVVVLDDATPEEMERLKAAGRILRDWLLENVPLNRDDETQTEVDCVPTNEPQAIQMELEL